MLKATQPLIPPRDYALLRQKAGGKTQAKWEPR
jgi:hypothetical protein